MFFDTYRHYGILNISPERCLMVMECNLLVDPVFCRFDDEFWWKAEIRHLDTIKDSNPSTDTFAIRVEIRWHEGEAQKRFDVSTIKIAARK